MSYIPSWCKHKYIQGIYSKGLYQNVLKISLVGFTKAKCIKSIGREQAVEQASTPFLNRKQDNQSHCFDLGPYGVPYNSCNPLNSTQLKHNTRKSKGVLQLNIRDNLGQSSCASYSLGPGPFSRTIRSPWRCHRAGRNTALRRFTSRQMLFDFILAALALWGLGIRGVLYCKHHWGLHRQQGKKNRDAINLTQIPNWFNQ